MSAWSSHTWYSRCHDLFIWCYVCFVLLRFRLYAFVEAAALRSIVLRYAGSPIATRVSSFLFFLLFIWRCRFFRVFFVPYPLSLILYRRLRRTFFPSEWCFSTFVTTGWIFDISLCENSINQSKIASIKNRRVLINRVRLPILLLVSWTGK